MKEKRDSQVPAKSIKYEILLQVARFNFLHLINITKARLKNSEGNKTQKPLNFPKRVEKYWIESFFLLRFSKYSIYPHFSFQFTELTLNSTCKWEAMFTNHNCTPWY